MAFALMGVLRGFIFSFVGKRQGEIMESKLGEHWFAYFMFLILFSIVGAVFLLLLNIFEIRGRLGFLLFFFSMFIIFAPIAKYWHGKFLNNDKDSRI
ncbi:MAG: hypothetical protein ACYTBX_05050 [Planctomycetota bacterium]